ncbi:MAG: hypothetical protein R2850_12510 [Bacteroidia bacterium]
MKNSQIISSLVLSLIFFSTITSFSQNLNWVQTLQSYSEGNISVQNNSIVEDNEGNLLISGGYSEDFTIGGLSLQPVQGPFIRSFLMKMTAEGGVLWLRTFDIPELGINVFQKPVFDSNGNFYLIPIHLYSQEMLIGILETGLLLFRYHQQIVRLFLFVLTVMVFLSIIKRFRVKQANHS